MPLAYRYWSLKPNLIADKFKDLIYVKHSLFLTQQGIGWGKGDSHQYLFIWKPYADWWLEDLILVWIINSFRNALY